VIVSALNWEDAIKRGERALRDMGMFGIKTTIPYYLEILRHPEFRAGQFNTGFVDKYPELINYSHKPRPEILASVIAAAMAAHTGL
jgi:pyruvate carboxylase subunit A